MIRTLEQEELDDKQIMKLWWNNKRNRRMLKDEAL